MAPTIKAYYEWPQFDKHFPRRKKIMEAPVNNTYYEWPPQLKLIMNGPHLISIHYNLWKAPAKYYEWPLNPCKSPFMTTPDPMIWT